MSELLRDVTRLLRQNRNNKVDTEQTARDVIAKCKGSQEAILLVGGAHPEERIPIYKPKGSPDREKILKVIHLENKGTTDANDANLADALVALFEEEKE